MPWILKFIALLSFWTMLHTGTAQIVEDPIYLQYAKLGASEAVLHCPVPEGTSSVEWRTSVTLEEDLKGVPEGSNLVLKNISLAQEGEYSCHEATTGLTLRKIHLRLGYPPKKPLIRCRSASYPAVTCSWTLETMTALATSFLATYRHGLAGEVSQCVQPDRGSNRCSINALQMFSTDPYILNVTAVNPLGTATGFLSFFLNEIVQPDPPENVMVSPIQGQRKQLLVEWEPPSSWLYPEYFPLKYTIRYSKKGSNSSRTTRPTEQTSFILTGIRSGVTYHIQVAAKDFLDDGNYSAWSSSASGAPWVPET